MPVVHDLKQAFPQAIVDWVVEESFAPLVRRLNGLDRVLSIADRRWRKTRWSQKTRQERKSFVTELRLEAYDAVIDFQGLIKSALVARRSKITTNGFRATFANASDACSYEWPVQWILDRLVPMPKRIHAVARYRALAAASMGYSPQVEVAYDLGVEKKPQQKAVVLTHGTTRPENEWPLSNWIALAQRLVAQGFQVWIPQAGGEELIFAETVAATIGPQAVVWPRLPLEQILDRMACATGVIGVDSGLSHMAVALDLPHVQIFSQPRAWRAGPVGRSHQRAVGGAFVPDIDAVWDTWQEVITPKMVLR
jgi:heptosyltransferase I